MNKRLVLVAMTVAGLAMQPALACDPKAPRCKTLNSFLGSLDYENKLLRLSNQCESALSSMDPDEAFSKHPEDYHGMIPGTDKWPSVRQAYQIFVEETCGGTYFPYIILERYRVAWDKRLPGKELDKTLAMVKKSGSGSLGPAMKEVREQVKKEMDPIVEKMTKVSIDNYKQRLLNIANGVEDDEQNAKYGMCPIEH